MEEIVNVKGLFRAEQLKAATLAGAKREASKRQKFAASTVLIGVQVDDNGFIVEPVALRWGRWRKNFVFTR
jgi:hypothetical protein